MGNEMKYQRVLTFWVSRAKQGKFGCPDSPIDGLFRYDQKETWPEALGFGSGARLLVLGKEIDNNKTMDF